MPPPPLPTLQAAQALNGQLDRSLELPYADEPIEEEEAEEEERQQLLADAARAQLIRKPSLGQRRNVEMPQLLVVNELPAPTPEETPPPAQAAPTEREHFGHGMRRNSISLPSGINAMDLDALRRRHQMQADRQDALHEESHNESVSLSSLDHSTFPGVNDHLRNEFVLTKYSQNIHKTFILASLGALRGDCER